MKADLEVIATADRLAAIVPAWRQLWSRVPDATPFQSPDWLMPWWDIFAPGELRIMAFWDADILVGIAPLYLENSVVPRLLPLGISVSDYLDLTFDPDYFRCAAVAFGAALDRTEEACECEFPEVPNGGQVLQIQPGGAWQPVDSASSSCPVVTLPDEVEKLGRHVPPSRLRHLRTARRRAARRGETSILVGDSDNAGAMLAELVRLELLRWVDGVFSDSRVVDFHAAALPALVEQGIARLYAVQIADNTVGVWYGFAHHDRTYAYLCAFDPDYKFESPGAILIGHAIEEAVREGAREFDFLRGRETYKYEWGASDRVNTRRVFRRVSK